MAKEKNNSDISALSLDELNTKSKEIREQIFRLSLQKNVGQLADTSSLKHNRKLYAQVLTYITQKTKASAGKVTKTNRASKKTKQ